MFGQAGAAQQPFRPANDEQAAERRRLALLKWHRHSRMIHGFRRTLPATMVTLGVLLSGWVGIRGLITGLRDGRDAASSIHMSNARFFGRDGDGRAYVLAAAEAARDDADFQRIELTAAMLRLDSESPAGAQISADKGVYRENDRILRLRGHVTFRAPSGDVFTTEQAVVDTVNGTVIGPGKVRGAGPTGAIAADAFEIQQMGSRVLFRGNVHSRLKQG